MVIPSALMATSLFLFVAANTQASNIGLNVLEYFFQSMINAVLHGRILRLSRLRYEVLQVELRVSGEGYLVFQAFYCGASLGE
jgi:hypothetical protein